MVWTDRLYSVGIVMAEISQRDNAIAQAERQYLEHTFAMTLVGTGCWTVVTGVAYFLAFLVFM
jgi:hypothetical protein